MLDLENPVFVHYAIAAMLGVIKVMGQGWWTVHRMQSARAGFASPEDMRPGLANPEPREGQLDPHPDVERSRRMHRNDLENIPAFWAAGLVFTAAAPPLWLAATLFYGFVLARAGHAWAYGTARSHEIRAAFFTVGSVIVIVMALWGLAAALL